MSSTYFEVEIEGQKVNRLRVLFNWLLAIPHLILLSLGVRTLLGIVWVISLVPVLLKGQMPNWIYKTNISLERYWQRVTAFTTFSCRKYPPFEVPSSEARDSSDYPAKTHFPEAPDKVRRSAILNFILVLPHYIWLAVLGLTTIPVGIVVFLIALIAGRYPKGIQTFMENVTSYYVRVGVFVRMIDNKYPPFSISAHRQ